MFQPRLVSLLSWSALVRAASVALVAQVAGAGLNLGVQIVFARWAGAEAYGAYSYAMAWAGLLATLCGLGLPQALVRFVPEYLRTEQPRRLRGVVRRSEHLVALCSGAVGAGGLALTLALDARIGLPALRLPLLIGFGALPMLALLRLYTELCIARQQMTLAYLLPRVGRPLGMLAGAAVVVWGRGETLTAGAAVCIAVAPVPLIGLVQRAAFHRGLPAAVRSAAPAYATRTWLRTALPMLLITGFLLLLGQTDLLMIGLLRDAEQVGLFKVASKMASLVLFPLFAVNAAVAPRIAASHAAGDTHALRQVVRNGARWMAAGSLAIAALVLLGTDIVLGLFGDAFRAADSVLWILAFAQCANACAGPVGPLLTMTGHQDDAAWVYGGCALLNVVLNAAGILAYGTVGAALATAATTVLWNVGLYRIVVARLDVRPSVLDLLRGSRLPKP